MNGSRDYSTVRGKYMWPFSINITFISQIETLDPFIYHIQNSYQFYYPRTFLHNTLLLFRNWQLSRFLKIVPLSIVTQPPIPSLYPIYW